MSNSGAVTRGLVAAILGGALLLVLPSCSSPKTGWDPQYRTILRRPLSDAVDAVPIEVIILNSADGAQAEIQARSPSWVCDLATWRQNGDGKRFADDTDRIRWDDVDLAVVVEEFQFMSYAWRNHVLAFRIIVKGREAQIHYVARRLDDESPCSRWEAALDCKDVDELYHSLDLLAGLDIDGKSYDLPDDEFVVFGYSVGLITVVQHGQTRQYAHGTAQYPEEEGGRWVEGDRHDERQLTGRFYARLFELCARLYRRSTAGNG